MRGKSFWNKYSLFSARVSLYVLLFNLLLFAVAFLVFYYLSTESISRSMENTALGMLENTKLKVENELQSIKILSEEMVTALSNEKLSIDSLRRLNEEFIGQNDLIAGSAIIYNSKEFPFALFSQSEGKKITTTLLPVDGQWIQRKKTGWLPLHYNPAGEKNPVETYFLPFSSPDGEFSGEVAVDISMDWLVDLTDSAGKPFESAYIVILDKQGNYIIHPDKRKIRMETIYNLADKSNNAGLKALGHNMANGERGMMELPYGTSWGGKQKYIAFYTPIMQPYASWSIALLISKKVIFHDLSIVHYQVIALFSGCLLLMSLLCLIVIEKIKSIVASKERMESELQIAHDIQMGMVPEKFPAFPEREDISLYARLRPARRVGGDLYDFFIKDNKLYFIIGDVSGKGVPAALFMATTKSAFDSIADYFSDPAAMLRAMNNVLIERNTFDMFVTLFAATLDLQTGEMLYCNAGHNPPVVISRGNKSAFLHISSNIPVGVLKDYPYVTEKMQFGNHTTLMLYTDGLTEAENRKKELFGNRRLLDTLMDVSDDESPQQLIKRVEDAIQTYVEDAEQNDDIALLAVSYSFAHELILHSQTSEIARINAFVETIGEELQLLPALTRKLNLALEEVVANIVRYAYGSSTGERIVIRMTHTDSLLLFVIEDTGFAFDSTAVPPADIWLPLEKRRAGGLGIHLVRQIMDEVEYRRTGNTNQLQLKKILK